MCELWLESRLLEQQLCICITHSFLFLTFPAAFFDYHLLQRAPSKNFSLWTRQLASLSRKSQLPLTGCREEEVMVFITCWDNNTH